MLAEESRQLLIASRVGRLGCVDNGEPYVVPINHYFEDGSIYSHSQPGRKIDILRSNPRACLQVDYIEDDFNWRSAIAYGVFEEILDPSERRTVLREVAFAFSSADAGGIDNGARCQRARQRRVSCSSRSHNRRGGR